MKIKTSIVFLISALLFLFSSCDSSTNPPPEEKPPGYQEDVPWPSLVDSPWPIAFGDPQLTKRSKSTGGITGLTDTITLPFYNQTGIAIGRDSTLYYTAVKTFGNDVSGLVALSFDGQLKWIYEFNQPYDPHDPGSPIIDSDGIIYTSSFNEGKVFAIRPDGTLKWEVSNLFPSSYIYLGKDGALYLFSDNFGQELQFVAINKNGDILWKKNVGKVSDIVIFSPDGNTAYFSSLEAPYNPIIAFDLQTQNVKWEFTGAYRIYAAKSADFEGNIFFLGKSIESSELNLYKISESGELIWNYIFGKRDKSEGNYSIAQDKNGNIDVVLSDTLYSVSYQGKLNWKTPLENNLNGLISIDVEGNVYFVLSDSYYSSNVTFASYNDKGEIRWKSDMSGINNSYGYVHPIAIGFNCAFFIGYRSNYLVRIN